MTSFMKDIVEKHVESRIPSEREDVKMKLTKSDKEYFLRIGHNEDDLKQLEKATGKTKYTINYKDKISTDKAIELLGREAYLSGISRSTFHRTAEQEIGNTENVVVFDSSALFK